MLHFELAGVPRDKITLDFHDGALTVSGERTHEKKADALEKEQEALEN